MENEAALKKEVCARERQNRAKNRRPTIARGRGHLIVKAWRIPPLPRIRPASRGPDPLGDSACSAGPRKRPLPSRCWYGCRCGRWFPGVSPELAARPRFRVSPNRSPATRVRFGKEEGHGGCGVFPALTQTGKTEQSRALLTQAWGAVLAKLRRACRLCRHPLARRAGVEPAGALAPRPCAAYWEGGGSPLLPGFVLFGEPGLLDHVPDRTKALVPVLGLLGRIPRFDRGLVGLQRGHGLDKQNLFDVFFHRLSLSF